MASFSIQLQVRYAECDMQGHVFNGHYLTWFDMAHTALMAEALGRPWSETLESGIDVVVIESGVRYRAPAHFEDELTIDVALDPLTRSSMTSRYTVRRADTLIAEGFLRHVCVVHGTTEKLPWPEEARQALAAYASTAQPPAADGESADR
jgi:acyl-CoA thioester hydrolase